jgi:phosphoribosyl 1,2-cyclic phosphate phosphodiesterase
MPIVIDTGPEFRLQLLRAGVLDLQHVLYTHLHADHCHGFDDLRGLYFNNKKPLKCYLDSEYVSELKHRFHYAFEDTGYKGGRPDIELVKLPEGGGVFKIQDCEIETIRLQHGNVLVNGFRFGSFAYVTDFKNFTEEQISSWRGKIDVMISSGLRWSSHGTHSSTVETIAIFKELGVKRGILTHLSHDIDYQRDMARMPNGVELAYDGMTITL